MVSKELVFAWEDAYRRYFGAAGPNVVDTSRAVASAWRGLAESDALPWWLSAAVRSAAEAFERQAEAWQACAADTAGILPPPRRVVPVGIFRQPDLEPAVRVPRARASTDWPPACADPDIFDGRVLPAS